MSTGSTRRCPGDGDLSIDLSDVAERISLRRQLLSTAYVASWQILLQKSLATLLNNDSVALMRFAAGSASKIPRCNTRPEFVGRGL